MSPYHFQYIILHGCPPSEDMVTPKSKRWMNWLETQLIDRGKSAIAPDMPRPWHPHYSEWKEEFQRYPLAPNTILIGHSCSGAFLVRYLLETGNRVRKLILVAPAKVPEGPTDPRRHLYDFTLPVDGSSIADDIVLFISNDLPHHVQSQSLYIHSLQPRVIRLDNRVHFLYFQMHTNEFPELLEESLR